MKEVYQVAEMDIFNFSMEDVIATSAVTDTTAAPPVTDDNTTAEMDPF